MAITNVSEWLGSLSLNWSSRSNLEHIYFFSITLSSLISPVVDFIASYQ